MKDSLDPIEVEGDHVAHVCEVLDRRPHAKFGTSAQCILAIRSAKLVKLGAVVGLAATWDSERFQTAARQLPEPVPGAEPDDHRFGWRSGDSQGVEGCWGAVESCSFDVGRECCSCV